MLVVRAVQFLESHSAPDILGSTHPAPCVYSQLLCSWPPCLQTWFSWLFPWKQTMVPRAPGPGKAGMELCNYLHASCSLQKWMLCLGYTVLPVSTAMSRAHWHPFLPTLQGTGGFSSWAVEHRCGISCNRKKSSCLQSQRSREHRPGRRHEIEKAQVSTWHDWE